MVLADLGRKLTTALRSLGNSPVINEEVLERKMFLKLLFQWFLLKMAINLRKSKKLLERGLPRLNGSRCQYQTGEAAEGWG